MITSGCSDDTVPLDLYSFVGAFVEVELVPSFFFADWACLSSTAFFASNGSDSYIHFWCSGIVFCSCVNSFQYSLGPGGRIRLNCNPLQNYGISEVQNKFPGQIIVTYSMECICRSPVLCLDSTRSEIWGMGFHPDSFSLRFFGVPPTQSDYERELIWTIRTLLSS